MDIKHISKPGCHVAISAEIKINLEGIGQHSQNCFHGSKIISEMAVSPCDRHT